MCSEAYLKNFCRDILSLHVLAPLDSSSFCQVPVIHFPWSDHAMSLRKKKRPSTKSK